MRWKSFSVVICGLAVCGILSTNLLLGGKGGNGGGNGGGGNGGGGSAGPPVIAFASVKSGRTSIKVMDDQGDQVTTILSGPDLIRNLSWSFDGTRLGFSTGDKPDDNAIVSLNPDGGDLQVHLTYADIDDFNVDVMGRDPISSWLPVPSARMAFSWDPQGEFLVVSAPAIYSCLGYREVRNKLYLVRLSDGAISQLTHYDCAVDVEDLGPHWSPSLDIIIFVRNPPGPGASDKQAWVVDPATGDERLMIPSANQLNDDSLTVSGMSWSHGGDPATGISSIAYQFDGVLIVDLDTTKDWNLGEEPIVGVTHFQTHLEGSAWSPDDTRLVARTGGGTGIAVIDIASGTSLPLYQARKNEFIYNISNWRTVPGP